VCRILRSHISFLTRTGDEIFAATGDSHYPSVVIVKSAKKLNKSKHAHKALKLQLKTKQKHASAVAAAQHLPSTKEEEEERGGGDDDEEEGKDEKRGGGGGGKCQQADGASPDDEEQTTGTDAGDDKANGGADVTPQDQRASVEGADADGTQPPLAPAPPRLSAKEQRRVKREARKQQRVEGEDGPGAK